MVQKSNEENSSISNDYDEDFENEEGIHRSSQTGIEDEANEEEKDLNHFQVLNLLIGNSKETQKAKLRKIKMILSLVMIP